MLTVRYTNTRRDILAFYAYHYFRSPGFLACHVVVLAFLSYSFYTALPEEASWIAKVFVFTIMFSIAVAFLVTIFLGSILVHLLSKKNKTIITEHTITLRDSGFVEETIYNTTDHKWTAVQRLRRSNKYIFIYIAAHLAHLVPRRAFSSDKAWEDFYLFCHEKLKNA